MSSCASGKVKAPIVIGRDHLGLQARVASPNRETESMKDGTDAVADWPLLNAMVNTACRSDLGEPPPRWRRGHRQLAARGNGHRGGWDAGCGRSPGARAAADPGTGVMRHADAGYDLAVEVARERGVDLPGITDR